MFKSTLFKALRSIFSYGMYVFIIYVWWHTHQMQEQAKADSDHVNAENLARIEEAREQDKQITEKSERFMDDMRHEVALQITRNVFYVCKAQLDPNCEYLQSLLREGKVKASEIGTTPQEVSALVQQYRVRYANFSVASGQ